MNLLKRISNPGKTFQRDINLDIIRIVAFIFVPGVHFFLHNGYYSNTVDSPKMIIMTFMRTLFLLCIPLFLLLTGYLQGNKKIEPCKKYYLKITKFLVPYLIIMTMDLIYILKVLGWKYSIREYVENFTSYTHYSWYVEMYIGLFLLIPFLNMIWQNTTTKKQEYFLIATLFVLTILPTFFNAYEFDAADGRWFAAGNKDYWKLFPGWWTGSYPICYYFVGAFLARHKNDFRIKPIYALLIFLACWGIFGTYVVARCYNGTASVFNWTNYNSVGIFLMGVTLFIFLNSISFKKVPVFVSRSLGRLSDLTFGAYLCSWMLDQYIYSQKLNKMFPVFEDRFNFFIPVWLCTITVAFVLSLWTDLVYRAGITVFTKKKKDK